MSTYLTPEFIAMADDLIRSLVCYTKANRQMVFDIELDGFDLDAARSHFGVGDDIEMVLCYAIDKCTVAIIQGWIPKGIDIQWDNPELAFYLECRQRDSE